MNFRFSGGIMWLVKGHCLRHGHPGTGFLAMSAAFRMGSFGTRLMFTKLVVPKLCLVLCGVNFSEL